MYFKYFKVVSKYGINNCGSTTQEEIKDGYQVKVRKLISAKFEPI